MLYLIDLSFGNIGQYRNALPGENILLSNSYLGLPPRWSSITNFVIWIENKSR
jgi:hypothetical protein